MLRTVDQFEDFTISATDGQIGHVRDFYFDDDTWVIRYLVVDAGSWLSSRKVVISSISLRKPDWAERTLRVSISREQVRNSPDIDTDKPVSRQHEERYLGHYGYPLYWGGAGLWAQGLYPNAMTPGFTDLGPDSAERERNLQDHLRAEAVRHRNDDPRLRSCKAVVGYHIHATDGDIGHVAGFLMDDETWAIRCLVVDTSNWWIGHKVLITPAWINGVDWSDRTVSVDVDRESIKNAPEYDAMAQWGIGQDRSLDRQHGPGISVV